ncbi:MAG: hypothetical protein ACRDTF_18370 [Pseudonocardiaceae bacterium]
MRKRPKSKEAKGLETRRIVYGDHRCPHNQPQELRVDVRRGEAIDEDYAVAMVAARTTLSLCESSGSAPPETPAGRRVSGPRPVRVDSHSAQRTPAI